MFEQQVQRGAVLLDALRPGWRKSISVDVLDLSSGCLCILGQIYGTFHEGLNRVCGSEDWDIRWNFSLEHGFDTYDDDDTACRALEQAWITALQEGNQCLPLDTL